MKPISKGSGKWEASCGEHAKFGLSIPELLLAVESLERRGKSHWIKLLHFHIGSQVPAIVAIKKALREATRVYAELYKRCPSLSFLDVGGGLAVDYDGSRTNFDCSMNYTVEEYARDVVSAIGSVCHQEGVPAPEIVTEGGRALVAHHAVIIAEVIDVAEAAEATTIIDAPPTQHESLKQLIDLYSTISVKNCQEALNDASLLREEIFERFVQGDISLIERAYADKVYWQLIAKVREESKELRHVPEDIEKLDEYLRDTYFCNFSVFQSLPDSWAIDHLFPVMPISRLNEQPTRNAIIADLSCDSDGKIERFTDLKDVKTSLPLHKPKAGEPYFIGIFLVGAYQEILGDLHNLFGDTNAVHVDLNKDGSPLIHTIVEGDTAREVLSYVQFDRDDLVGRLKKAIDAGVENGTLTRKDGVGLSERFEKALEGYTYLKV